jgi:hypothetical protein
MSRAEAITKSADKNGYDTFFGAVIFFRHVQVGSAGYIRGRPLLEAAQKRRRAGRTPRRFAHAEVLSYRASALEHLAYPRFARLTLLWFWREILECAQCKTLNR